MTPRVVWAFFGLGALVLLGCTNEDDIAFPELGKNTYETSCQSCHGADGLGATEAQPPLAGSELALGAPEDAISITLDGSLSPVLERKLHRYPNVMPSFRHLSDRRIAAVLTWVRSSFGNQAPAIDPAEVASQRD